jgi:hypothetical protein
VTTADVSGPFIDTQGIIPPRIIPSFSVINLLPSALATWIIKSQPKPPTAFMPAWFPSFDRIQPQFQAGDLGKAQIGFGLHCLLHSTNKDQPSDDRTACRHVLCWPSRSRCGRLEVAAHRIGARGIIFGYAGEFNAAFGPRMVAAENTLRSKMKSTF